MCTYYYLHYHHLAPCTRAADYAIHYSFCENSTCGPARPGPWGGNAVVGGGLTGGLVKYPCDELTYSPEYNSIDGLDYNNPCATRGCLISQHCSSGGCRLEELGGRWVCCQCGRGGNSFRWCDHPMRKVPDTFCYHVICQNCWGDH